MTVARAWSWRALLPSALMGLVLCIASARASAVAPPASKTVPIVITGIAFAVPEATAIVGDTVTWTNKDVVDHTATARHGEWRVEIKAGKSASLVMKQAGSFDYYCEFHPNMTAHLLVKKADR
jgi:plastocyanin